MSNSRKARGRKLFETHLGLIEELVRYISRRSRLSADEREDFTSYAMLKLVENDYGRLRKYRGDSSFKTYLTVVLQRLFLDYRTQKWGKWRPSTAAKRLGTTAVKLETLLYRDGVEFHEAREMLLTGTDTATSGEALWELAVKLPRRERPKYVDEETAPTPGVAHEDDLDKQEKEILVRNLEARLADETKSLTEEDRNILKMRFDEGLSVPEIAEALELSPKALYAKIGRLLKRMREALESSGVCWDDLEGLLSWTDLDMDLERVFGTAPNRQAVSV